MLTTAPLQRAGVNIRQDRCTCPRSREGLLVRLCTVALFIVVHRKPRARLAPPFNHHDHGAYGPSGGGCEPPTILVSLAWARSPGPACIFQYECTRGEDWSSARGTHVELRLGVVDALYIKGVVAAASGPGHLEEVLVADSS